MNLRQIANRAITTVNPNIPAVLKLNAGTETDDTGKRVAKFDEINVKIQPQSLSTNDLQLFDSLAQQGQLLNVYISGQIHALRRLSQHGADKLVFKAFGEKTESEWLIRPIAESFPSSGTKWYSQSSIKTGRWEISRCFCLIYEIRIRSSY